MVTNGLLIASGLSSRISGFKPLLQYEEKSFLITIVEKMLTTLSNIVIVVGYNHNQLIKELNANFNNKLEKKSDDSWIIDSRIEIIYNENYQKGMFTSLQLGTKQLFNSDWILYHFIDQPNIPNEFYTEILKQQINSNNWIQPIFKGAKGHPVLIDKNVSSRITNADDNSNLREILKDDSIKKHFWDCSFPQILEDVDTDDDYQKLLLREHDINNKE